jgi:uncharacterized protein
VEVRHEEDESRFVIPQAGNVAPAELRYSREIDGTLNLLHTYVPSQIREQGLGGRLVEGAVEHARRHDLKIRPSCPFVRRWFNENPGYGEMIDGPAPPT